MNVHTAQITAIDFGLRTKDRYDRINIYMIHKRNCNSGGINMKKALSIILCLCLLLSVFATVPFGVSAEENDIAEASATSGVTGDCTWKIEGTTLTISGSGDMGSYNDYDNKAPWRNFDITEAVIEEGVTTIGQSAFTNCGELAKVTIADSVTSIGKCAFESCRNLSDVIIPNSVTTIQYLAFLSCSAISDITIPDSVTRIETAAFYGSGIKSLTIGKSLRSIGNNAFFNCPNISSITIDPANKRLDSRNDCNAIIDTVNNELMIGCGASVIPDSVTSIAAEAFSGCTSLKTINIPDSVTSMGDSVFQNCTGLTNAIIGNSIKYIENGTFGGCTSLMSVTIGNSVRRIGYGAFSDCSELTSITIPSYIQDLTYDDYFKIDNGAFSKCTNLTTVILPDNTTAIKDGAFVDCINLKSITLPKNTTIDEYALGYCRGEYDERNDTFTYNPVSGFKIYGCEFSPADDYAFENNFEFIPLTTKTDNASGISLDVPEDYEISVNTLTGQEAEEALEGLPVEINAIAVYDISVLYDGSKVQPENAVKVKLPCNNPYAKVFRKESDGVFRDMNALYYDGCLVFNTDRFSVYVTAEEKSAILGDVDFDGNVEITDATWIQRHAATIDIPFTISNKTADADGDGNITVMDATAIRYYLARIKTSFNIGKLI